MTLTPRDIVLGRVRYRDRDGDESVVTLYADGTWEAPDAALGDLLSIPYSLHDYSPGDGRIGAKQLAEVARLLGGTVELPAAKDDLPPGTVY